ncbi:MAG TPA: asparagine synthase (glutamine-hydrolyzing) [Candidatus Koribacter sp.]|jgi:asparagine synthase (glutamine-hydrolysing)
MCGISGLIQKKPGVHPSQEQLRRMTDLAAHRGPDGFGYWSDERVAFGHRRLAIIDLSEAASQPMHALDKSTVIVFNGEIFNYLELRDELKAKGHAFRTQSDTEVILAAYAEWGEECPSHFNGMWAFALYDRQKKKLFCSLDRFGIKPFHYVINSEVFAFGSEIKQLLELVGTNRCADRDGLETFLLTGLTNYSDQTLFADVKRLPAAHNLIFDVATGTFTIIRYYDLQAANVEGMSAEALEEQFRALFTDAVRLRLRSDVPVATCLSGGLDSSIVATVASRLYRECAGASFAAVTAVSIDSENDESRYAKEIVDSAELAWHRVQSTAPHFLDSLNEVVYQQEEPFPSLSILMQYEVMKTARANGIPVLLDGQGADEAFLGYNWHVAASVLSQWHGGNVAGAGKTMFSRSWNGKGLCKRMVDVVGLVSPGLRTRVMHTIRGCGMRLRQVPLVLREWSASTRDMVEYQKNEITKTVLPALLRYEDRNSMAFAVEGRLPFLDYRMVEFALGLPLEYKLRDGWSKWIMRQSMATQLPHDIAWRRDKLGFEAPKSVWKDGVIANTAMVVRRSELLREIADVEKVARLAETNPAAAWRFHSAALWAERFNCTDVN